MANGLMSDSCAMIIRECFHWPLKFQDISLVEDAEKLVSGP